MTYALEITYKLVLLQLKQLKILIPLTSFCPECALLSSDWCSEIVFEINDAPALRLDNSGTHNRED